MTLISIIIVNWNTTEFLVNCLAGIFEDPPTMTFEVIVVDNNSNSELRHVKQSFPEIRLIECSYNYGFAVGNNIGFQQSVGTYVMTLNPDTIIMGETIDKLVRALDENEDVGIAAPVLGEQRVSRSQYSFDHLFFGSIIIRKLKELGNASDAGLDEQFDVDFLGGTGYMCRASLVEDGRLFSEDTFLFGEEYELCRRISAKGYKIRVVPAARFEHHTSVSFKNDLERLAMASKLGTAVGWKIRNEYYGRLTGTAMGVLLTAEIGLKWVVQMIRSLTRMKRDFRGERMLRQSKSIFTAGASMLFRGDAYFADVNKKAAKFFNNGRYPEYPPRYIEFDGKKEVAGQ